jgi:probable HAF family extracellular repeat protein
MRHISCAVLLAAAGIGCSPESEVTQPEVRASVSDRPRYTVEVLSSLGGTQSRGMAISGSGRTVAGWSNEASGNRLAAVWRNGTIDPLPTLGGPAATLAWPGLNDNGLIVGISLTDDVDPEDEDWACELGGFLPTTTNLICRGFVYFRNQIHELPTLGGHHGFATQVNEDNEIVGWSETVVRDPTCDTINTAQRYQFIATKWTVKRNGAITTSPLRPLRGDSTSAATDINDRGVAVGISGACDQGVGRFSATSAVMWDRHGKARKLPDLGGGAWQTPMSINNRSEIVGFGDSIGGVVGELVSRGWYWKPGMRTVKSMGMLPNNTSVQAFAINDRGQAVGISFGGTGGTNAFLWEKGRMKNLNDLVNIAPDHLMSAQDINDDGEITGRVLDAETGQVLAVVLRPVRNGHDD